MGYLNMLTFTASVQSLAVISMNRYVKICLPNRYIDVFTYLNTAFMCLGVWLVAGLLSLPPLLGWAAYSYLPFASLCFCNWALSFTYALFMIFVCFCIPCVAMTFCNVSILRAFLHSRRAIQSFKDKDNDDAHRNHVTDPKPEVTNHENHDAETTNNNTLYITTKLSKQEVDKNVKPKLSKTVNFSENPDSYTNTTKVSLNPSLDLPETKSNEISITSRHSIQSIDNYLLKSSHGTPTYTVVDSRGGKHYDDIKGDNVDTVVKRDTTDVCTELSVTDIECNDPPLDGSIVNYLPDICCETCADTETKTRLFTIEGGVDQHTTPQTRDFKVERGADQHTSLQRDVKTETENLAKGNKYSYNTNTQTEGNTGDLLKLHDTKDLASKQMELAEAETTSFQIRDSVIKFTHAKNRSHATRPHDHIRFPSSSTHLDRSATLVPNFPYPVSLAPEHINVTDCITQHKFTKTTIPIRSLNPVTGDQCLERHSCCTNCYGLARLQNIKHVKKYDKNPSSRKSRNTTHLCTINEVSELKIDKRPQEMKRHVYKKAENSALNLPTKQNIVKMGDNHILNSVSIDRAGKKKDNPQLFIESQEVGLHLSQRKIIFQTCFNYVFKRLGLIRVKEVDKNVMTMNSPNRHDNMAHDKNVSHDAEKTISKQTADLVNKPRIQMDSVQNDNATISRPTQGTRNNVVETHLKHGITKGKILEYYGKDAVEIAGHNSYSVHDLKSSVRNVSTHNAGVLISVQPALRENVLQNIDCQHSALEIPGSVTHGNESPYTLEYGKSRLEVPGNTNHDVTSGNPSASSDDNNHAQLSPQKPPPRKPLGKSERRRKEEFQLAGSLVVVIVLFVVCWFPYCISMFISVFTPERSSRGLDMTSLFLGYFNSCVNPVVYGLMNKKFKAAYIKLFTTCIRPLCKKNRFDLRQKNSTRPHRPVTTIAMSTSA